MFRLMERRWLIICLLLLQVNIYGQLNGTFYSRFEIYTDTLKFDSRTDFIYVNGEKQYFFEYSNNDSPVVLFKFWCEDENLNLFFHQSAEYEILDSLKKIDNQYWLKIRFKNLTLSDFLNLHFYTKQESEIKNFIINLLPVTSTYAKIYPSENELFIGEEKQFEIVTNNTDNLNYNGDWTEGNKIDYRIAEQNGKLYLHVIPNETGKISLDVPLRTKKPLLKNGKLSYTYLNIKYEFSVKSSRLNFLSIDKKEITLDEYSRVNGIEIQLENSWQLAMNKTYRIEGQEVKGGALIAEIFTKQRLSNNKILCVFRPYNYHRISSGYLYIKDGDLVKSITNVNITPKTQINAINILRSGNNWIQSNVAYPGETIEVRLNGEGMHKASFIFEGLENMSKDSALINENQVQYKFHIPENIAYKKINIYNHGQPTGNYLKVLENKKARKFDYIFLNYGDISPNLTSAKSPILYEKTVKDVILTFNNNKIDQDMLYGPQYLDLEIRITGRHNELIEMRTIEDIIVCPDESSPRYAHYPTSKCITEDISLNKYIRKKTYDLDDWSRIELKLTNKKEVYGNEGYEKEIEIVLKKNFTFDVDVSFPAGLITISKQDVTDDQGNVTGTEVGFGSLSGISMAMIAQFSFYHPQKIAKYRPYKIGAGFLAFNAFNFSEDNQNRDVGMVILGSLYPTTKDTKLTFPLYVGGGYFLKAEKWFMTIGPGIRVKL